MYVLQQHLEVSVNGRVSAVALSDRSLKHPNASVLLHALDSLSQILVLLAHLSNIHLCHRALIIVVINGL